MIRNIIVIGGSWGLCPMGDADGINRPSFSDLIAQQGYNVINLSRPNQPNRVSIGILDHFLSAQKSTQDTIVFFVESDPFTSLRPYTAFTELIIEHGGMFKARKHVMQQDYLRLENVAEKFEVPVFLIGTVGSADQNLLCSDGWCKVFLDTWVRFLVGDRHQNREIDWNNWGIWGQDWTFDHISINVLMNTGAMSGTFGSLAEQVIEELTVWDQNNRVFTADLFPDGQHPNREGHKILFDHIMATVLRQEK